MAERDRGDQWFVTRAGRRFWPMEPEPRDVFIDDVAHGLAMTCRFGGHCRAFYSVAQHSVLVSRLVPGRLALHGLMHDAAEAYCGDLVRPLKRGLPDYTAAESRILRAVLERFGLLREWELDEVRAAVKLADRVALVTERRDLIAPHPGDWPEDLLGIEPDDEVVDPLGPGEARESFMRRFHALQIVGSP